MATYTDNYNLIKPTYAETADIVPLNNNFEKIDEVMHSSQISLAPAYDQTKEYAAGDTVMYELLMYKCTAPTTGVWDPSKWERTTASESGGGGSAELDILGEASGAVASFADGASAGLAKCIVEIAPKQAGSGTPSPDNVRAISGYTAVKVDVAGKNLCRVNTGNNVVVAHCKAGQTYTFSIRNQGNCGFNLKKNTTEGEQIVRQDPSTDAVLYQTFTADEDFDLFLNGFGSGGSSFGSSAYDYQLELGSDATTYEAYAGSTTTTALGQTVYGGRLNVLTGELTIDKGIITFDGSENWSINTQSIERLYLSGLPTNLNLNKREESISNSYKYGWENAYVGNFSFGSQGIYLDKINASETLAEAKSRIASNPVQVVYPLATPQTVQLTPQEVNSLLGQNNISADTGDVDIVYVKASAPIQPNPTGTPTATLKKLGIEGTVFEVEGGGGGSSGGINYSTNEQVIGTWIDGKPLYQKTIELNGLSETSYFYDLSILGCETCISANGLIKLGSSGVNQWVTSPFLESGNYMAGIMWQGSNNSICIKSNWGMSQAIITVQYTKITD